jgi:hypothetical protein
MLVRCGASQGASGLKNDPCGQPGKCQDRARNLALVNWNIPPPVELPLESNVTNIVISVGSCSFSQYHLYLLLCLKWSISPTKSGVI